MILRPVIRPVISPPLRSVLGVRRGDDSALDIDWSSGVTNVRFSGGQVPSFSRASTATRINASGLLESVATGAQAIDYTAALGWAARFEEQKTNLLQQSEAFNAASWSTTNVSIVSNPDGPTDAATGFFLREDSVSANHNIASEGITHSAQTYTFSVYAKAGTPTTRLLFLRSPNFINKGASFNLATGIVTASSADSASIQALGNGWYRCSITYLGSGGNGSVIVGLAAAAVTVLTPYLGDGSSRVCVFGAQLETGGLSSYIPTFGATAVRQADSFNLPTASWWSAATGTFFIESGIYSGSVTATNSQRKLAVLGTGFNQLAAMIAGFGADLYPEGFVGNGTTLPRGNAGTAAAGPVERIALSYSSAAGSFFSRNGAASGNIGNFIGAAAASMDLGQTLNGYIRRLRYWPRQMSAAELAALTA